ncbi:hypothetical protein E1263_30545 [Kribbella antibiotica]|uniref:Uncharacterized protein n=1 Tax=Kribbella antibiotica TaxID=190195 RepID=A0A4R4YZA0_9ACTN|nr:hypothetical protein [Kribbella antibiotica]TDD50898.1 hypothetical protein E1263_30545 [Kribbella antibiotica]
MTADNYEYLARVFAAGGESADRPSGLWRHRGNAFEYLSMVDWAWHPQGDVLLPHPDLRVVISTEQAELLLADRQRFAKYWVERLSPAKGDLYEDILVYRLLRSPERLVEEGFGRANIWAPTDTIKRFRVGGPHDVPDLEPIDRNTAERLIQETRGISGATDLHQKGSTA